MEPKIHNEPNHTPSEYLAFNLPAESHLSAALSSSTRLSFFRVELARIRPGMSDFLMRVATPKYSKEDKNTVVTLRGSKAMAKFDGARGAARVLIREMKKRNDKTHSWDNADEDHLAQMLSLPLKAFALNTNMELLRFSTEALR